MSLWFPAVKVTASGTPAASTSRWCLEPARARSTGEGPLRPPSKGADVARVYDSPRPVDPASGVRGGAEVRGAPSPTPLRAATPKAAAKRSPQSTADLPRDHPPRHPTHQHEHDRRERSVRSLTRAPC